MKGLDWIIAPLALIAFALSMGVIVVWVPDIDLAIVCIFAVALASYDFWLTARRSLNGRDNGLSADG